MSLKRTRRTEYGIMESRIKRSLIEVCTLALTYIVIILEYSSNISSIIKMASSVCGEGDTATDLNREKFGDYDYSNMMIWARGGSQ